MSLVDARFMGMEVALLALCACSFDPNTSFETVVDPPCTSEVTGFGVEILNLSDTLTEGAGASDYTLRLQSQPCANVRIEIPGNSDLEVVPSSLDFSPDNWNLEQTISVSAIFDFEQEGLEVSMLVHSASSADQTYDALDDAVFDLEILDRSHLLLASIAHDLSSPNADCLEPTVSLDGRYVAFSADADNLVSGDSGNHRDVFVRDLETGTIERISQSENEANGRSEAPRISNDGQTIAYFSRANNLTAEATSGEGDVFQYQQESGATRRVSALCGGCNNEISSDGISISGDGLAVAYTTRRALLTDSETEFDVFLDRAGQEPLQSSLNSEGGNGSYFWGSNAFTPRLAANGNFVGFNSAAQALATPDITVQNFHSYLKDVASGALVRVSAHNGGDLPCDGSHQASFSSAPWSSADGNLAAFTSACVMALAEGIDTNGERDVILRDIAAKSTRRVSVASDGTEANGESVLVGISDDGAYVVFVSSASNLVAGDTNGADDVFVHEVSSSVTRRISYGLAYEELPSGIAAAGMSRDARFVVFTTADALSAGDDNGAIQDVYRVQLR